MSWWATLLGGTLGFVVGGPIGALLGAALGQSVGFALRGVEVQGADDAGRERTQVAFFTATFGVMGHVAKADGRVSPDEIGLANRVMDHFGINEDQRRAARAIFNEGKAPGFPLDAVLDQLRRECGRAINLLRLFLEIQVQAAWADGGVHAEERRVLKRVASRLGFPDDVYIELERLVGSGTATPPGAEGGPSLTYSRRSIVEAGDRSN